MPRRKKTEMPAEQVTSVTPVTKVTPVTHSREKTGYRCMDCEKAIYAWMKIYTVKYRKGGIAITCPICALKKKVRLRAEGITYDAQRFLDLKKEDV